MQIYPKDRELKSYVQAWYDVYPFGPSHLVGQGQRGLNLRPFWASKWVQGQPELQSETLPPGTNKQEQRAKQTPEKKEKRRYANSQKDVCKHVYRSIIHNSPKLKTTQMFINW